MLRRSPLKRPVPPPSLARVKVYEGCSITPRTPVCVPVVRRMVLVLQKDEPVRDEAYIVSSGFKP